MNGLACGFQHCGHGVLRPPVDLQIRDKCSQFPGDREIALNVAEPDGGGDKDRPLGTAHGPGPPDLLGHARLQRVGELLDEHVDLDRIAPGRHVTRPFKCHELASRQPGHRLAACR